MDGATPQPAQRMTPDEFEAWALKHLSLAGRVVCCYEAGPFGYSLQRRFSAAGITCRVVRPQDWDKHGQRVKTDGREMVNLGNPRLRHALVEAVWRLMRRQPGWKRLEKVMEKLKELEGKKAPNKKKIAVALARELTVDLWRLNTGRARLEDLGFIAAEAGKQEPEQADGSGAQAALSA